MSSSTIKTPALLPGTDMTLDRGQLKAEIKVSPLRTPGPMAIAPARPWSCPRSLKILCLTCCENPEMDRASENALSPTPDSPRYKSPTYDSHTTHTGMTIARATYFGVSVTFFQDFVSRP